MKHARILVMATCLAAAALSGCALTTDRIELGYTPPSGVAPLPGAGNVSVGVQVNDQRPDKSKVSSKKNTFGMEMAPILANEDVTATIRRAMEQELRARGFRLDGSAPLVQVVGDLTRFYNDHKLGFFAGDAVADLNMAVTVKSARGELLYTRQLVAQGIEPNTQLMSGENARLALDRALAAGMKSLFQDQAFLAALLKR